MPHRSHASSKAAYKDAIAKGDFDGGLVWAGEGIDLIHAIEPAGAIVERVVAEAEAALARRFD
jgi:nitronate monooxygenase